MSQDARPLATEPATQAAGESGTLPEVPAAIRGLSGRIEYVGPDTFILLDADGRPQPVPGMSYEDFLAAWKKAQNVSPPDRQPRFVVEDVHIGGTADERRAVLKYELTVRLLTNEPVAVPLALSAAILQGQPRFWKTSQESRVKSQEPEVPTGGSVAPERSVPALDSQLSTLDFLAFDAERGGWVAWFNGQPGERHTLSFDMLVPLSHDGAATMLSIGCPRALVSRLTVEVRPAAKDFGVTSGTVLSQEPTPGGTRLEIAGAMGQFAFSWKPAASSTPELGSVLAARGAIRVSIDGRSVRSDARLTVQSYGGRFDRFRVRLPVGAKLIEEKRADGPPDAGRRISIEASAPRDGQPPTVADRPMLLVQLFESQAGPVVVDLSTEQPLSVLDADAPVELAGFEVLGAVRQFGDITLRVADDWQARWDAGRYVRQVDPSEIDSRLQQTGLTAAFQYDRQPWSLGVRFAARRFRVYVTPQYFMECLPDEARLRVRLAYQVLGPRAHEFRVDLKGWELTAEPIESGGLVDRDRVVVESDGTLVLPLAQASTRRAEIAFVVRRATPRDSGPISLPLPMPAAESVGTGELVVRAAVGIELTPDMSRSIGLTPTPVTAAPAALQAAGGEEFRFHCLPLEAVFAAERARRTRDVSTESRTQVDINALEVRTDQWIDYNVRFEPIQELTLTVPQDIPWSADRTEVVLTAPVAANDTRSDAPESTLRSVDSAEVRGLPGGGASRIVKIMLPQPRLGRFSIRVRANWDRPALSSDGGALLVPLAIPAEGKSATQRAVVVTGRELAATITSAAATSWQPLANKDASVGAHPSPMEYVASRPEAVLPLIVSAVDLNVPSSTVVERAWLQTWISGVTRQDRAAFRFRSIASEVAVELPPETQSMEIEVLLDGRPAPAVARGAGRLVVPLRQESRAESQESRAIPNAPALGSRLLALDSSSSTHTLELRYRQTVAQPLVARSRLTPPQMVAVRGVSEMYWQLVLAGDRHIVRSTELTPCSRWQWLGSFFGRRPTKSQAELEQWAGATSGLAPSDGQSEYLYSGLAPAASIELVTAPRWLIVLVTSAGVLMLAIAWIYVPVKRRGWIVAMSACLLGALAVTFPTPAVLLGQASVVGLLLATLAMWLARLASRVPRGLPQLTSGSSGRQATPHSLASSSPLSPVAAASASSATAIRVGESEQ
ncbi:MAG: hypothetical protein WD669_06970 [Pirellulales bacterium]